MADDETPVGIPRTTSAWQNVAKAVHDAIRPNAQQDRRDHLTGVLEQFEQELAPLLAPIVADLASHPATPESVRPLLQAIKGPEQFTQSLLIGIAVGSTIGPVLGAAIAPEVQQIGNIRWPTKPDIPLSPPEIALGVIRNNPHINNPAGEAAMSGINAERLQALEYNTGEPPSPQELLLLYRRGQIDQARLETGIRQSRIRDEWFPEVLDLRFAPPAAGEVIAGAIKGHLPDADATTKLGQAGIDPSNFAWMKATAGRPPGIEQMLHLWNRGVATEADVDAAVRQSDINDTYLPFVKELRKYFPPPRSIVPMLRANAITEAQARTLLTYYGVDPQWVDAFIAEAHTTRTSAIKELSASQTVRAYENGLIDQPTAMSRLEGLKYPAADATLMLQIADEAVTERYRNARVTRVHARYVAHKIDQNTATAELSKFGLPGPAISQLMTLWTDERDANTAVLSLSQTQGAYHRGIITLQEFITRAHAMGYSGLDVKIVAAEAWPPTRVPAEVLALNPAAL